MRCGNSDEKIMTKLRMCGDRSDVIVGRLQRSHRAAIADDDRQEQTRREPGTQSHGTGLAQIIQLAGLPDKVAFRGARLPGT